MKIFVTGSESFIGKELIKQCQKQKIEIIGIDLIDVNNTNYKYIKFDICSNKICNIIPDDVDIIIHLAALSRDSDCKGNSYNCFNVNVMGTLNLMRAAKNKKIKQFIFASSEWVYDHFTINEEKDEKSIINIFNQNAEYAVSKIVSEINLKQEFVGSDSNITILRFGIIYGPRKHNWSAVEEISSKVKNQEKITINSLKTGRRFIHVNDIVNGIILSIGLKGFNTINLTGNQIITLEEIIKTSEKIFRKKSFFEEKNSEKISIRNPSNKKAKKLLKWEPKITLEYGVKTLQEYI